ncbi:TetR/AcrR family transcriptional regulator [Lacticaseibacillus pantheris]|jgi:AcrR family transcriptional regulator|uniref:TetR/AcrR family transcriptional regulator n=1 Tax=Lacticaseibacillus pantheris TaxID=171523 RepID=UPI0025967EF0|nr:TetR/AcrR family transcriptional regulator [Lacticaseibacillus pantheris]WKF84305.1 helix-turn-helix domain-containing protein [Lacticaseibacillus pantheris]
MARTRQPIDPEKSARIIDVAMHAFAQHGYRDTNTEQIAERAGVSKGLIFHYFQSKANLYVETVRATYSKIVAAADMSVWQDSADLKDMVVRALRYKIQLQLRYPDEFALAMQAYAEVGNLPERLRPQLQAIWSNQLTTSVPDMVGPVLQRMPLRAGVTAETISNMILMLSNAIGEQAKVMVRANPQIKIEDFDPVVDQAVQYMDVLEHGFLAE